MNTKLLAVVAILTCLAGCEVRYATGDAAVKLADARFAPERSGPDEFGVACYTKNQHTLSCVKVREGAK